MRKSVKGLSDAKAPKDSPPAITRIEYDAQQRAFEYLNKVLFDDVLPNVAIVYSRRSHSGGHFAPDRFTYRNDSGGREHELSLNPDSFTVSAKLRPFRP